MLFEQRQDILLEVPFGMTTAAILYVAAVGFVSEFSECLAYRLALFTCYQYSHNFSNYLVSNYC